MVRVSSLRGQDEVVAGRRATSSGAPDARPNLELVEPGDYQLPDVPPEQRRGIGAWLVVLGVTLDAALIWAITTALVTIDAGGRTGAGGSIGLFTAVATLLLLPTHRNGRLARRPSEVLGPVAMRLAVAPGISVVFVWWISKLDKQFFSWLVLASILGVLVGRLVSFKLVHAARSRGFDLEDVLIVGAGSVGRDLAHAITQNPDCGLVPVGFVDRFEERAELPLVGRPEDLYDIIEELDVRHVILGFGAATEAELVAYVRECAHLPVQFYTVPRFFELGVTTGTQGFEVDGFAVSRLGRPGRRHLMWPFKRAFDIVVSAFILLLTAPLFAVCALAVKLTSPGPIFFRQQRVSVDHVPFDILKFRTMTWVADPDEQAALDQQAQAVNLDDARITSIGGFLRSSHLDELPQLLNVLKGEMSIVGPRPERPYFVDQHSSEIHGYAERHRVPAGITGWAQVNGFWGDSSLEARVRLDNRYIESWSPWRDLVIGLRTIPTLLGKRR